MNSTRIHASVKFLLRRTMCKAVKPKPASAIETGFLARNTPPEPELATPDSSRLAMERPGTLGSTGVFGLIWNISELFWRLGRALGLEPSALSTAPPPRLLCFEAAARTKNTADFRDGS